MAKRLSEKQKEEIVRSFKSGISIDVLSQNHSCTTSTIIRNLKKNLGQLKYQELFNKNKNNVEQANNLKKTNFDNQDLKKYANKDKNFTENNNSSNFAPDYSFLEIAPVDFEIENLSRKELSSVPLSDIDFPKVVYMIVDKKIELEIRQLKDFPKWEFLPNDDLNRKTIEIFFDLNLAKRSCNKEQKVLKVPNTDVFRIAAPILIEKGISRIVCPESLIAL